MRERGIRWLINRGRDFLKDFWGGVGYIPVEHDAYLSNSMRARGALDRALLGNPAYPHFDPLDASITRGTLSSVRDTGRNYQPPTRPQPPGTPSPAA